MLKQTEKTNEQYLTMLNNRLCNCGHTFKEHDKPVKRHFGCGCCGCSKFREQTNNTQIKKEVLKE